jgi:putative endonuclease
MDSIFYVYVLWSEKIRKRYIGTTRDLKRRFEEHNKGNSKFTRGGIPWILIYYEEFESTSIAHKRELFLKTGVGRRWLDQHLRELKNITTERCESG